MAGRKALDWASEVQPALLASLDLGNSQNPVRTNIGSRSGRTEN
jgi:hypothetical protein